PVPSSRPRRSCPSPFGLIPQKRRCPSDLLGLPQQGGGCPPYSRRPSPVLPPGAVGAGPPGLWRRTVPGMLTVVGPAGRGVAMSEARSFLSVLTGSFAMPAAENPTVAMVEAAYRHHGLDARYLNCEVPAAALGDAVRGARAMGWVGFNCSIPHKVAVLQHLDGLGESAAIIGA